MNEMRIEMNNAAKAAEAIKRFVEENAVRYPSLNKANLLNDLRSDCGAVILGGSYAMHGYDYLEFVPEVLKMLAGLHLASAFSGSASFDSGYGDEGSMSFAYSNNTLTCKTIYFPEGNCFYCPDDDECGELICNYEDLIAHDTFTCPSCGKVFSAEELLGERPVISETVFEIL